MSEAGSQPPVITVPERHANVLAKFAALADAKKKAVYGAAAQILPTADAWDTLKDVLETQLGIPADEAKALGTALMGLFHTRQRASDKSDAEFIQGAVHGIEMALTTESASTVDLQKTLVNVLALQNLDIVYRAGRVRYDYANHMHNASIVTDLRPIFDVTASSIEGAVICHVMKIDYASNTEDDKDLYFAVDDDDLERLEAAVKRARRKGIALRAFAKSTNLKIIEDKS